MNEKVIKAVVPLILGPLLIWAVSLTVQGSLVGVMLFIVTALAFAFYIFYIKQAQKIAPLLQPRSQQQDDDEEGLFTDSPHAKMTYTPDGLQDIQVDIGDASVEDEFRPAVIGEMFARDALGLQKWALLEKIIAKIQGPVYVSDVTKLAEQVNAPPEKSIPKKSGTRRARKNRPPSRDSDPFGVQ